MTQDDRPSARSALRRRSVLTGAAAVGALPLAGCSSPLGAGLLGSELSPDTLVYWNLFGGGDGGRMQDMVAVYRDEHGPESVEATTFAWGNPYYSKVTLATVGDQPPDVAIAHLTRALPLWDGDILEPFTDEDLQGVGLSPSDFNEAAWEAQQVDGQNIAIPLDTHPFVLFFNREVCEQADLVESDGRLVDLDGLDTFESALEAISEVTGGTAITLANVGEMSTPWRFFSTVYNQFEDATPFLSDGGAELTVNEDLFMEVMSMVQRWTENGWLNRGLDYAGSQTEMFTGRAGMYMQGEWEISTAQTIEGLDFGMQPDRKSVV